MPDVVAVFFVEFVFCDGTSGEGSAPEEEGFFNGEANAFEEKGVLETAKVFEMFVAPEGLVEVHHTCWKVGGEGVNGGCGNTFSWKNG